jgi:cell wall-associated NlpC family hydrolase
VFFGPRGEPVGHVGVGLGKGLYAHARACTRISSMESGNNLFDNELAAQFRGWRRPAKTP